ncbi:hypothetical protein JCM11251_003736 [Rhodosporidiobolus azoricus]
MVLRTLLASSLAGVALAQSSFVPLVRKRFEYDALPYQADTDNLERGRQYGYNLCNSTTQGQDSNCQTAIINAVDDFCLWAPPEYGEEVGNIEGEMVAWCTKEGHGTRIIPEGALRGVQFTRTPHYVQVVGYIDQQRVNILPEDYGGEMDPHGADQRGNPLGGLLFSNAWGSSPNGSAYQQVVQWHNFMGANMFCLKACDPSWENGWAMCEHIYDRIGCAYNAPASYAQIEGTYTSCDGDDQLYPGQYIGADGQRTTYTQPPESLGVITYIPYTAAIPSSSNCQTYESSQLYTQGALIGGSSATTSASSAASTSSGASSSGASSASGASASSGASSGASQTSQNPTATGVTGANNAAQESGTGGNGAGKVAAAGALGGVGALLAAFLA